MNEMSQSNEIPLEIMEAARRVRSDSHSASNWFMEEPHVLTIAKAILAERRNCAKIAADFVIAKTEDMSTFSPFDLSQAILNQSNQTRE